MDSYTDDMPFRRFMDPDTNPLFPDSKVSVEIPLEYQTNIEIIHGNLTNKRFNPLMPGSTVDAMPCGHGDSDCERRAMILDLQRLGATPGEVRDILAGYQNDPGCHECSV